MNGDNLNGEEEEEEEWNGVRSTFVKLREGKKKKKKQSKKQQEDWNGIRSSLEKLREERNKQLCRSSLTTTGINSITNNQTVYEQRGSMVSVDTFAEMEREDLVAENVRLTQLMLDMEGLDELVADH